MDKNAVFEGLRSIADLAIKKDEPMSGHCSFRIGGPAALYAAPENEEALLSVLAFLREEQVPYFVMGNGSNLLFPDGEYPGLVLDLSGLTAFSLEGERVRAAAGCLLSALAAEAARAGLAGLEFASGIPGSLGGALFMNAGAYGGEMSQVAERLRIARRDGSGIYELSGAEMDYGYRHSRLMDSGDIVTEAVLKLKKDEAEAIKARMAELSEKRRSKQPLQYPSAGSFFKRPEGDFAGRLIQEAGLKGLSVGGARVSPLHAGFIINEGGATAADVKQLMKLVQAEVLTRFGVQLEPEVRIL